MSRCCNICLIIWIWNYLRIMALVGFDFAFPLKIGGNFPFSSILGFDFSDTEMPRSLSDPVWPYQAAQILHLLLHQEWAELDDLLKTHTHTLQVHSVMEKWLTDFSRQEITHHTFYYSYYSEMRDILIWRWANLNLKLLHWGPDVHAWDGANTVVNHWKWCNCAWDWLEMQGLTGAVIWTGCIFFASEIGCIKHRASGPECPEVFINPFAECFFEKKNIGCFPLGCNNSLYSFALDIGVLMWGFNPIQPQQR